MTIPPFEPRIDRGRLYGRGSCDVKGSMAAMLTAFARLVRERPTGSANVLLAFTVDEEFTHTGSSRLAEMDHKADLAIVAEPTSLNLVDCHKGALRWKIRTRGVACHSSTPHLGQNAIYRMRRVLEALETYADSLSESTPDPVLGPPSLSVGRIEGGQSVNVVPDWCEIEIDRRLIPGEDAGPCLEQSAPGTRSIGLGKPDWLEFGKPWVHMPPLSARAADWLDPLRDAIATATGRRPVGDGRSVRDRRGSFERERDALRRVRTRRHRPGPYQGRVDRARASPPGRSSVFPDRRRAGTTTVDPLPRNKPWPSSDLGDDQGPVEPRR